MKGSIIERNIQGDETQKSQSIDMNDPDNMLQSSSLNFIIDKLEISFREQYISRRDQWILIQWLNGKTVYKNKQIEYQGIRARIRALYSKDGKELLNGLINIQLTKITFYTKSSQMYILFEVASDMYMFDQNGFIFSEKAFQFLQSYFERCIKNSVTHEVCLVLYSRLFYPQVRNMDELREALTKFYKQKNLISDLQMEEIGAFQISLNTRVFQDIYIKAGVFEIGMNNWETVFQKLKSLVNHFPSMVNWKLNCPDHVNDMKKFYTKDKSGQNMFFSSKIFQMTQRKQKHYMLECEVVPSEKQNILEAINLTLFNLNNEEIDQNLKNTGQQLLILTAGQGSYRVNADAIKPTKSRVLLGGIPVQIVSLSKKPNFKTPLFINCCTYSNPFKEKPQAAGSRLIIDTSPMSNNASVHRQNEKNVCLDQNQKEKETSAYIYPYWIDIAYVGHVKVFETHAIMMDRQNALYKLFKAHMNIDFQPHHSFAFLKALEQIEKKFNLKQDLRNSQILNSNTNDAIKSSNLNQNTLQMIHHNKQDSFMKQGSYTSQYKITINQEDLILRETKIQSKLAREDLIKQFDQLDNKFFQKDRKNEKAQNTTLTKREQQFLYEGGRTQSSHFIKDTNFKGRNSLIEFAEIDQKYEPDNLISQAASLYLNNIQEETSSMNFSVKSHTQNTIQGESYLDRRAQLQIDNIENLNRQGQQLKLTGTYNDFDNESFNSKDSPLVNKVKNSQIIQMTKYKNSARSQSPEEKKIKFNPFLSQESFKQTNNKSPQKGLKFNLMPLNSGLNQKKKKQTANKRRWAHVYNDNQSTIYQKLTDEELNVMIQYGTSELLQQAYLGFWKNICECKIMPLTTDFYETDTTFSNKSKYHFELSQANFITKKTGLIRTAEDYIKEFICLRLTQNFQLINPQGNCFVDIKNLWQDNINMSICNKFNVFKRQDTENYKIDIYTKLDTYTNEIKSADFKYLLFNHHTNKFQVKKSKESRLFNFTSLANLGEVLHDFKNAITTCIKMPQIHFVVFYKRDYTALSTLNKNRSSAMPQSSKINQSIDEDYFDASSFSLKYLKSKPDQKQVNGNKFFNNDQQNNLLYDDFLQIQEENEIFQFETLKTQLYDTFTLGGKSKLNNDRELESIKKIEVLKKSFNKSPSNQNSAKKSGTRSGQDFPNSPDSSFTNEKYIQSNNQNQNASTVYIEELNQDACLGVYFLQYDQAYITQTCFHITISWIFASGPQIQEKINILKRRVRDCKFSIVPISALADLEELNPFEAYTKLRKGYKRQQIDFGDINDPVLVQSQKRLYHQYKILFEEMFRERFLKSLYDECEFIQESIRNESMNFIHQSGIGIIKIYDNNEIQYIENDIVNNQQTDYNESQKLIEKVEKSIISLDILIDIIIDRIFAPQIQ